MQDGGFGWLQRVTWIASFMRLAEPVLAIFGFMISKVFSGKKENFELGKERSRRLIWLIILGALAVRLLYLYHYQSLPDWDQLTVDNYYHHHWAQSIAGGNLAGDTTYFRAPFYIYTLSALYSILGDSIWVGRLFGLLVGLGTVFMTYRLGQRLFTPVVGLWAAALYALMPTSLYFESELLLDPLFTLLGLIAITRYLGWLENRSNSELLISGLLFGLAAITRPTMLVFIPIVYLYTLSAADRTRRWRSIVILTAGLTLVIGPIFARNLIVAGDPVLISSQGGINFYLGNNESADGVSAAMPPPLGHNWRMEDTRYLARQESGRSLTPGEQSNYWLARGVSWITANPVDFAGLYLKKIYLFFSPDEFSNNRSLPSFFQRIWLLKYNELGFGLIFPFALLGLAWSFRRKRQVRFVAWFLFMISFTSALFFITSRFRLPIVPLLTIFAAAGSLEMINRYRHGVRKLLPVLPLATLLALGLNLSLVSGTKAESTQDLLSKGLKHINRSEYRAGLVYLRAAREIDRQFPTTNLNLGICHFRLGSADSAHFYFEQEKLFHPNRPKSYINQASLYLVNDQFEAALAEIDTALALRPYDQTAQIIKLRTLGVGGFPIDALYQAALTGAKATANDIYILNEALRQFMARQGFEPAAEFVKEIGRPIRPPVETDDTVFDALWPYSVDQYRQQRAQWHFNLGFIYGNLSRFELSINHSRQAVTLDPAHQRAIQNLITGLESVGKFTEADSVRVKFQKLAE